MVDREKVIKGLEACIEPCCRGNDCPYFYEPDCGVLKKDALQLLKEQEPLVIHKCGFTAQCPECQKTWMMWEPDYMRYCPYCGRAVKWDATD